MEAITATETRFLTKDRSPLQGRWSLKKNMFPVRMMIIM